MIGFSEFLTESITTPYTWDEIESIAQWQNYGSAHVNKYIYDIHNKLPNTVKSYSGAAYRFILVSPKLWRDIQSGKTIPNRKLESYTTSLSMVKRLSKEIGPIDEVDDTYILVFIKFTPSSNQVFLNLVSLWKNKIWRNSVDYYQDQGEWFNEGLEFEDSQKEIILWNLPGFNKSHIVEVYDYKGKRV